jgi:hypothetical protein
MRFIVGKSTPLVQNLFKAFGLLAVSGSGVLVLSGGLPLALAHDEPENPPAPGSTWEPERCLADNLCGDISPLIPMTYNAVGASTVWTSDNWENIKVHYKGRHSEFKPIDVYDINCVEAAVLSSGYSAWPIPRGEWAPAFPGATAVPTSVFLDGDTVERFDTTGNTHLRKGLSPCIRSSFKSLVYGGYTMHQGQSLFVANRIKAYWTRENAQVWDLSHPDAFRVRGVFDNSLIDEADAMLNIASFTDAGASRGLNYSIYSLGYATLPDGRVVNIGGHNMQSNSGFRKLNIYNPETNSWAPRPVPCNIARWRADPGGVALGYKAAADAVAATGTNAGSFAGTSRGYVPAGDQLVNGPATAPTWTNCDMRNREQVDPPDQSDMRYQRWYPSGQTLPDGTVMLYGGDDLDESVASNLADPSTSTRDTDFRNTRIFLPVPEVYDPVTNTTLALENARKIYPLYPQAVIIETGPGDDDWAQCVFGGEAAPVAEVPPGERTDAANDAADWRRFCTGDPATPEGKPACAADTRAIRLIGTGNRPAASLDCLNVRAAKADPNVNVPGENHYTHIATAKNAYGYCCGEADIIKLGANGQTLSHRFITVNGTIPLGEAGAGTRTNEIEMIDFAASVRRFSVIATTYQPGSNVHLLPLPDGTVFIRGGSGPGGGSYELRQYTKMQIFNPDDNSIRIVSKSTQLGGLHKTLTLLPTGEPIVMGGDRSSMVQAGDRTFTPGDQDLGVSVAQIFSPPYLFSDAAGTRKARPVILGAPDEVRYRQAVRFRVEGGTTVTKVTMFRTGSATHELHNDYRLVVLNFKQEGSHLTVDMPFKPAQAIAGDYMLFVIDQNGTPSMSKHMRLLLDRNRPVAPELTPPTPSSRVSLFTAALRR